MNDKSSQYIQHFQLGLVVAAGIVALALAFRSQDGLTVAVKASYIAYGILFLVGALAYYVKPRIGSAILTTSLLSTIAVIPIVGFPVWVDGSTETKTGSILGALVSASIVCGPLLNSSGKGQA